MQVMHKLKLIYMRHKLIAKVVGVISLLIVAPDVFAAAIDLNAKLGEPVESMRGLLGGNGAYLIYAIEGISGIYAYKKSGNNIMALTGIAVIMFFLNFILGILPGQAGIPTTGG